MNGKLKGFVILVRNRLSLFNLGMGTLAWKRGHQILGEILGEIRHAKVYLWRVSLILCRYSDRGEVDQFALQATFGALRPLFALFQFECSSDYVDVVG